MSYSNPVGNAVNFSFTGAGYTRPTGNSVYFTFPSSTVTGTGSAEVLHTASGVGSHLTAVSGIGDTSIDNTAVGVASHGVSGVGVSELAFSSSGLSFNLISGSASVTLPISGAGIGAHSLSVNAYGSATVPFYSNGSGQIGSNVLSKYAINFNAQDISTSPSNIYDVWASELGVSNTATLYDLNADDNAIPINLASPFLPGGSDASFYAGEGGIGFYLTAYPESEFYDYSYTPMTGINKFLAIRQRPSLLLTFRKDTSQNADLKSYNGKIQKSGSTTIIFCQHSDYSDQTTYRFDVAIKIVNNNITLVIRNYDFNFESRIFELQEGLITTNVLDQQLLLQIPGSGSGSTFITKSLNIEIYPKNDSYIQIDTPLLGLPEVVGYYGGVGPREARIKLNDIFSDFNSQVYVTPVAFISNNLFGPLSVLAEHSIAAKISLPHLLSSSEIKLRGTQLVGFISTPAGFGDFRSAVWHDFTANLGDAQIYYEADFVSAQGVKTRIPISSWQATLQTEQSNYVQCVVPAAINFSQQIEDAVSFDIYRIGLSPNGFVYSYLIVQTPINSLSVDQGPYNFTCTVSGYSEGAIANENNEDAKEIILTGVRSISSNNGKLRARVDIDWLLRPTYRAIIDNKSFVVSYINYYVNLNDSYMDIGES